MGTKRVYGIDLGTTYSCIAYVDEHGRPVVVPNAENETTTPSVVYFEGKDSIVVGNTAKEQAEIVPERCVTTVKRNMGNPDWEFAADGKVYKPQDISSFILRKVVEDAQAITGDSIKDVVITCPAYFGLNQKEATKQAGALAGLNVLYVIPEPTAAAIAYGMEQETDQTILVYDLGGGTFDVTLIRVAAGEITVLTTGGDDKLGGRNWDEAVVDYLAHGFEAETGTAATEVTGNRETYQGMLNSAERAKKKLSSALATKEKVQHDTDRATVEITRQKFDEITGPYLERTISLTKDLLARAAAKGHSALDKVLLVGGSCYMPQVLARVAREIPAEVKMFDPNQAVAKGAAIFGFKCFLDREIKIRIAGQTGEKPDEVRPDAAPAAVREQAQREVAESLGLALPSVRKLTNATIKNVSSKSFGLVVLDRATNTEVVTNLIVIDDPVPKTTTQKFSTHSEGQTDVELVLMENQDRGGPGKHVAVSACEEIRREVLEFGRGLPTGSPIEVTFALGPDGLLSVDSRDLTTGRALHVDHQTASIMSKEEIEVARSRNLAMQVGG